jgi:hypothetical protein
VTAPIDDPAELEIHVGYSGVVRDTAAEPEGVSVAESVSEPVSDSEPVSGRKNLSLTLCAERRVFPTQIDMQ